MKKETKRIGDVVTQFFTSRGVRCFRLVKKLKDGRTVIGGHFSMKVYRNGRTVYFSLPSTQVDAAREANRIDSFLDLRTNTLDMAIKEFDPDKFSRLNPTATVATVGALLEAHEAAEKALGLESVTAKGYRGALLIVFRQAIAHRSKKKVAPTDDELRALSMAEFTHRLASDFKVARVGSAGEDKAEIETKKRSVNAVTRSVASLFSQDAMKHYTHLSLPADLPAVLEAMAFAKISKKKYRLPPGGIIRAIYEGAGELRKSDPNAYLAFLLAGHAGLREGEVAAAVLDWIEDGEKPRVWVKATPNFVPKAKDEGWAEVYPWVIEEVRALVDSPSLILGGNETERTDKVFRRLNAWLSKRGLTCERRVHELRKLYGSYIANTQGIFKAQKMLRQATPQITSDTYADVNLGEDLYALWSERPAWAVKAPVKACSAAS